MNQSQIRNLNILTDDASAISDEFKAKIEAIEFCDVVSYTETTDDSYSVESRIDTVNAAIVTDIDNLSHCKLISLIQLVRNNEIVCIFTNDKDQYDHCYKSIGSTLGLLDVLTHHAESEDKFVEYLQRYFTPENINIAFITDNTTWMNRIFNDLIAKINEHKGINPDDDDKDCDVIDQNCKVALNNRMPSIIQGWVWRVWYGVNTHLSDKLQQTVSNTDTRAYVARVVSVRINEFKTVTYHWIKPMMDLDLYDCVEHFDSLYLDLCTKYNKFTVKCVPPEFITFVSEGLPDFTDVDNINVLERLKIEMLNIFKNKQLFDNVSIKNKTIMSETILDDEGETIKGSTLAFEVSGIHEIHEIIPFEEEETE